MREAKRAKKAAKEWLEAAILTYGRLAVANDTKDTPESEHEPLETLHIKCANAAYWLNVAAKNYYMVVLK